MWSVHNCCFCSATKSCLTFCNPMNCNTPGFSEISQETGKVVWHHISLRILQFVVIHTVKGFSIVNEAEVDFFTLLLF